MGEWWKDKSFWAAFFMIAAMVAGFFGISITEGQQVELTNATVTAIEAVVVLIGIITTIVDQIVKRKKIRTLTMELKSLKGGK